MISSPNSLRIQLTDAKSITQKQLPRSQDPVASTVRIEGNLQIWIDRCTGLIPGPFKRESYAPLTTYEYFDVLRQKVVVQWHYYDEFVKAVSKAKKLPDTHSSSLGHYKPEWQMNNRQPSILLARKKDDDYARDMHDMDTFLRAYQLDQYDSDSSLEAQLHAICSWEYHLAKMNRFYFKIAGEKSASADKLRYYLLYEGFFLNQYGPIRFEIERSDSPFPHANDKAYDTKTDLAILKKIISIGQEIDNEKKRRKTMAWDPDYQTLFPGLIL